MQVPITIGVVMDFFRPAVIEGAGAYARENGVRVDARWSVRADWMPENPGWHGVLAHFTDMAAVYARVMALGVPVVHLSGWLGASVLPQVQHDYAACAGLAVEEFGKLGIRRIAAMDYRAFSIDLQAYRGLRVAVRRAGMDLEELSMSKGIGLARQAMATADQLEHLPRPLGLFMVHAGLTWSVVAELVRRGIRVPEDVAIIVIDKDAQQTCALAPVPLTAVNLDDWQQGYEAARMAHRMILDETSRRRRVLRIPPAGLARRESTGVSTNRDPVVAKALHLIGMHPAGGLGAEELARRVGVSRRNFEQRFRNVTGGTPHAAILERRMKEAKRLLGVVGSSVADVAEACGFRSVHYFTTAFKRECGMTPGAFRKGASRKRPDH